MGIESLVAILIQCLGVVAFVSAVAMLYHWYRWASQYKRAPGELQPFNSVFVRDSELTVAGVEHKRQCWFFWRLFVMSVVSTMALAVVFAKSANAS